MVFKDPKGSYEKLFDDKDYLLCALAYCARINNVWLIPDWYFVSEEMGKYQDSIWSDSIEDLSLVLKKHNISHFIDFGLYSQNELLDGLGAVEILYSYKLDNDLVSSENNNVTHINCYITKNHKNIG
jgi:hypothetical protein